MSAGLRLSAGFVMLLALSSAMPALARQDAGAEAPAGSFQSGVAHARDAVLPHVVSILVVREDFNQSEAVLSLSGGSGTIIDASGHVLTNAHVTQNGRRFRVVLNDGREFAATLRGEDPISDLSVLRIQAPAGTPFGYARFAPVVQLQSGDSVLAMGAPWGMRDSLSAGVVNNPQRLMVSLFEDEADYEQSLGPDQATARYYAWIQHDASINPGNSGGPLVDLQGHIVGVNTRGNLFGGDMAFAIPAPVAQQVAAALIAHGKVPRSDFGFSVRSVRGTGLPAGALVNTVDRGSNADSAGLKAGDLIVAADGAAVALLQPEDVPAFRRVLSERAVGQQLELDVRRGGTPLRLAFASVAQDDRRIAQLEVPELGLSVSSLTESMARARYLESRHGALVQGLRPGGPATTALPPLQVGDLIVEFEGKSVRRADDLLALELQPGAEWRRLAIDRRGEKLVALIRPAPKRIVAENLNELVKAWAGWDVQPVTHPMATTLGLPGPGFRITRIYPDGPAAAAGLRVGDLVQSLDGVAVRPSGLKETKALDLRIRNASTTQDLQVGIWREGQSLQRDLRVIEQPQAVEAAERRWNADLSITVRGLTLFDRVQRSLASSQQGVVVERVENGGYGGLAHLKSDDLIVRVDGREVAHLDDLDLQLQRARRGGQDKLSLMVMRGADTRLLFVDPPWKEDRP